MGGIVLVAAAIGSAAQTGPSPLDPKPDLRCGAYCLYVSLESLGIDLESFEQLERRLDQPSALGYSMAQLDEAARSFGASTLALKTSIANLRRRPGRFLCIALLRASNHYVCVYDADERIVYVVDPPNVKKVSADAFEALWSGEALLISAQPLPPLGPEIRWDWIAAAASTVLLAFAPLLLFRRRRRRPTTRTAAVLITLVLTGLSGCYDRSRFSDPVLMPSIELDRDLIDLGLVDPNSVRSPEAVIALRNRGTAPLQVTGVQTTCGCTSAVLDSLSVPADSSTRLRVVVEPRRESGSHKASVFLMTNDLATPKSRVDLVWRESEGIAFQPRSLDLSMVVQDVTIRKEIRIEAAMPSSLNNLRLESSTPELQIAWKSPLTENFSQTASRTAVVEASLEAVGRGARRAEIRLIDPNGRKLGSLPVSWTVGPPLVVTPQSLFASDLKRDDVLRPSIRLTALDDQPIDQCQAAWEDGQAVTLAIDRKSRSATYLEATLELEARLFEKSLTRRLRLSVTRPDRVEVVEIPITVWLSSE